MLRHRMTEAEDISGGGGVISGGGGGVLGDGALYPHCILTVSPLYPHCILTLSLLYPGSGGGGGWWCHHHLSKYCKKGKTLIL